MKKIIGYIGLGKMGRNMVYNLADHGWKVVAYNRSPEPRKMVAKQGIQTAESIEEMVNALPSQKLVWIMVSHQAVDKILRDVLKNMKRGDTIIDGGNSHYLSTLKNAELCRKKGVNFLDCGVSGGPSGAREGACCMVGGSLSVYKKYEKLFKDISAPGGYGLMGENGTGHFVKMVHNGIEYGMMQAIGEGFEVMKKSKFHLDLKKVVEVYNNQSVITSRLVGWLGLAYKQYGVDLKQISGKVSHSGEGQWTVEAARKLKVRVPIIKGSLNFRKQSQKKPSYTGQVVSALRNQFGGHEVKNKK